MLDQAPSGDGGPYWSVRAEEVETPKSRLWQLIFAITFGAWEPETRTSYRVIVECAGDGRFVRDFGTARQARKVADQLAVESAPGKLIRLCNSLGFDRA